jgi:hypothetical protein
VGEYDNAPGFGGDLQPSTEHYVVDGDVRLVFSSRHGHPASTRQVSAAIPMMVPEYVSSFQPPIAAVLLCSLGMIHKAPDAGGLGTVRAAKHHVIALHPMTKNPAATILTSRCQCVDRAFEGIEIIALTLHCYAKSIFIRITAGMTSAHVALQPS